MCIIAVKPSNHVFSRHELKTMWERNSDGAGFMYAEKGKLRIVKGLMKFHELVHALRSVGQKNRKIVLHFRIRTHGANNAGMTHPFPVGEGLGMCHNGVITHLAIPDSDKSDSARLASLLVREFAEPVKILQHEKARAAIEDYIGAYNKLVFMNAAGEVYILNESAGIWSHGIWYSNSSFMPMVTKPSNFQMFNNLWNYEDEDDGNESVNVATEIPGLSMKEFDDWLQAQAAKAMQAKQENLETAKKSTIPAPRQIVTRNQQKVAMRNAPTIQKVMDWTGHLKETRVYPAPQAMAFCDAASTATTTRNKQSS